MEDVQGPKRAKVAILGDEPSWAERSKPQGLDSISLPQPPALRPALPTHARLGRFK